MAIDTSNISFINYLWTKKNSDGTLTGIRLSKDNLPEYLANPIPILAGKNISITPTNAGIEISAAADGKVKTVNNKEPDPNGNVQLTAANVGALPIDNAVDSLNINKELACGSNGKICVGKFGVYDSNITLNVSSTTNNTYSGTIVIATQNGIICNAKVYGDATKALSNILYIAQESYNSNRGVVGIYLNLAGWSKNKIDIRCLKLDKTILNTYYTDLMTSITEMPTYSEGAPNTATSEPKKYTGTKNDIVGAIPTSATNTSSGLIKPWYSTTGASTYNGETSAPSAGTDAPNINIKSAKDGRYYLIETDKNGRAYVNVPWTDYNTTYDVGDGLLKSANGTVFRVNTGYETNNKNYAVQYGTYNDKTGLYVNVPWTNTNSSHSHSAGVGLTGSGGSGISGETYTYKVNLVNETKSGLAANYTESIGNSNKFYAVRLDTNGRLGVYVPWTSAHSQTAIIASSSTNKIDIQRASASNYRLLIQSGTIKGQGHSGTWSISLAESMPNSSYTVLLTRRDSNSSHAYVTSKSQSSFSIYGSSSDPTSSVAFDYVAICMV